MPVFNKTTLHLSFASPAYYIHSVSFALHIRALYMTMQARIFSREGRLSIMRAREFIVDIMLLARSVMVLRDNTSLFLSGETRINGGWHIGFVKIRADYNSYYRGVQQVVES